MSRSAASVSLVYERRTVQTVPMAYMIADLLNHACKLEHSHAYIETSQMSTEIGILLFISGHK